MIEVRSSPIHDRGAFAAADIRSGGLVSLSHLLVFGLEEWEAVNATSAANYVFHVEDCPDHPPRAVTGLAMSEMSFANHSRTPNVGFEVDPAARTVTFRALRDIAAGEELTIDYGDYAEKLGIS